MIARVIPSLRTPRPVASFDYAIPDGLNLEIGDLVRIPFRNKTIVGLVREIASHPERADVILKPVVDRYADLRLSRQTVDLLQMLAIRSFSSPASVLHAWLGTLPKKPSVGTVSTRQSSILATHGIRLLLDRWNASGGVLDAARKAAADGKRVLILTPWAESAVHLARQLDVPSLTSILAAGGRFKAWAGFLRGTAPILVATRLGAWLAAEADVVIIDEPENDDHKQDELSPRYDARWMAQEAHRTGTTLIEIGLTPRVGSADQIAPTIAGITFIDTHRADWSPIAGLQNRAVDYLESARDAERPILILHPIHGDRARMRCGDCGWTAACARCGAGPTLEGGRLACHRCGWKGDALSSCPSCGGTRLSHSRPGRETTARDLTSQNFPSARVLSLGEWNIQSSVPAKALVILTDLTLLAGGSEDTRRRERLMITFRRLADACAAAGAELVVQSNSELIADAQQWLTTDGCAAALRREWDERKAFRLPPAVRMVKLIVRGSSSDANALLTRLQSAVKDGIALSGPYAVERLPGSRVPRFVIHVLFPLEAPDTAIHSLLDPLLTQEILADLDPIAFFE